MPEHLKVKLVPPVGGAIVRMYRIGHGDCFLLAFSGEGRIVHVMIDCGYKPGSPDKIEPPVCPDAIAQSINETTNGQLDVAVITHEHQDHVNNIKDSTFGEVSIGQTWLAWTDDPHDSLADELRKKYKDELRTLVAAHARLAADGADVDSLSEFIAFELGGNERNVSPDVAQDLLQDRTSKWSNKRSIEHFKQRSKETRFLRPATYFTLPGTKDIIVYVLAPPRDLKMLKAVEPSNSERFREDEYDASSVSSFEEAVHDRRENDRSPFANKFGVSFREAMSALTEDAISVMLRSYYGSVSSPSMRDHPVGEVDCIADGDASWRQIDQDWLYSAEQLAIKMNNDTNNSSLVLAFELGLGGKVLLFAADAQAGSWRSWAECNWTLEDGRKVTARDLLSRVVLYKVGHHCSHNATLNGGANSTWPSLGWMAKSSYANEFTAMITAVPAWASTQRGWNHPMPALKEALTVKSSGRVLQTDILPTIEEVALFGGRLNATNLFFDLKIEP